MYIWIVNWGAASKNASKDLILISLPPVPSMSGRYKALIKDKGFSSPSGRNGFNLKSARPVSLN